MKITRIQLTDFQCYARADIACGPVNVFVGFNNSGKTALLRSLCCLQSGLSTGQAQLVRLGAQRGEAIFSLADLQPELLQGDLDEPIDGDSLRLSISGSTSTRSLWLESSGGNSSRSQSIGEFSSTRPDNLLVPHLTRRKTDYYQQQTITSSQENAVNAKLDNLTARIQPLASHDTAAGRYYRHHSADILGFVLASVNEQNGQEPGMLTDDGKKLTVHGMGEGVPLVAALLADLAVSSGKVFLIEEPENDLHPAALKKLMTLTQEASAENQFFVTTHSHIVLQHLGSTPNSKVYRTDVTVDRGMPTSTCRAITGTADRLGTLRWLGYELADFDLWNGWVIFEESSAEWFTREYLVPWFAPDLNAVRTFAASGAADVEPTFHERLRLTRFAHLEGPFKYRTWVVVDGDEAGTKAMTRLKTTFPDWPESRFVKLTQPGFELYYPQRFRAEAYAVLEVKGKAAKRDAKEALRIRVDEWVRANLQIAKADFAESADEVVQLLRRIAAEIAAT
jgi:hypothetical protein